MSLRPVRVLIADSDPGTRYAVAAIVAAEAELELAGTAGTTTEALALAEAGDVDVALVDLDVEGGGGEQLTRALRRVTAGGGAWVLAYAGSAERRDVVAMLRAGAIGYLSRDSAAEEIVAALLSAAHGRATISPAAAPAVVEELADHLRAQERILDEERERLARIRRVLDEGLIELVFQPIVSVRSGAVAGYEALARFELEPRRPPDQWFAEAWHVGLGAELERLAVRIALAHLPVLPPSSYLAVNVSPELVTTDGLLAMVESVNSERVVIEMTEHVAVADYERLAVALAPMREMGAKVSVDDTGAGFASLRHILRLRPDFIKLDRSITRHIDRDLARHGLARGLASFAGDIGAHIIGEGVETNAELEALRGLGVPSAQGYLFGRPGPLPPPA